MNQESAAKDCLGEVPVNEDLYIPKDPAQQEQPARPGSFWDDWVGSERKKKSHGKKQSPKEPVPAEEAPVPIEESVPAEPEEDSWRTLGISKNKDFAPAKPEEFCQDY